MKFFPILGNIKNAVQILPIGDDNLDGLIISRVLHEVLIQHNWSHQELFSDLQKILKAKHPKIVVLGVVNRVVGLSTEETKRFIEEQIKEIGHGHDPAKDYVDQTLLNSFMTENKYKIVDQKKVSQPLNGFDPSPWGETIIVYELLDKSNLLL